MQFLREAELENVLARDPEAAEKDARAAESRWKIIINVNLIRINTARRRVFWLEAKRMLYNILVPYMGEKRKEKAISAMLIHPEKYSRSSPLSARSFSPPEEVKGEKYQQIELRGVGCDMKSHEYSNELMSDGKTI